MTMTSVDKAEFIGRAVGGFEHVSHEPDKRPINYLVLSDNIPLDRCLDRVRMRRYAGGDRRVPGDA